MFISCLATRNEPKKCKFAFTLDSHTKILVVLLAIAAQYSVFSPKQSALYPSQVALDCFAPLTSLAANIWALRLRVSGREIFKINSVVLFNLRFCRKRLKNRKLLRKSICSFIALYHKPCYNINTY